MAQRALARARWQSHSLQRRVRAFQVSRPWNGWAWVALGRAVTHHVSVYMSESMHGSVSVQESVHAEVSTGAEYVSTCASVCKPFKCECVTSV